MSLLKRNKDKRLAAEKRLATRHAIVKMGVDRNVRDAYFQGLVFAAVANDDQIDESERTRLRELGEVLELTAEDVAEAIQCLAGMDDDAKMCVIEECARQLTNVEVAECFLKEFLELWLLGGGKEDEFGDFKSQLIDWMGDEVRTELDAKNKAVAEAEARRIAGAQEAEKRRKAEIEENQKQTELEKKRSEYESLRVLAHEFAKENGKRINRMVYVDLCDTMEQRSLNKLKLQDMFCEIGCRFVLEVEKLDSDAVQKLALDSAWMLIALSTQKLAPEDLPVKKTVEMLKTAHSFNGEDLRQTWGNAADELGSVLSRDSFELWFCEVTGATSVWNNLIALLKLQMTKQQIEKLRVWKSSRRSWTTGDLEKFAHSIGVSKLLDGLALAGFDEVVLKKV